MLPNLITANSLIGFSGMEPTQQQRNCPVNGKQDELKRIHMFNTHKSEIYHLYKAYKFENYPKFMLTKRMNWRINKT